MNYVKEGSTNGHLSTGAPLGNQEGGLFTGNCEKQTKDGCKNGKSVYGSSALSK